MKPKLQTNPEGAQKANEVAVSAQPLSARVGRVVAVDETGRVWVQFEDEAGAVAAGLSLAMPPPEIDRLMAERTPVLIAQQPQGHQIVAVMGRALAAPTLEADVDGQRMRLSAEKEVVIACGKASITLRSNGRVIIKGTQVESYSEGTNRIKGGQVRIN